MSERGTESELRAENRRLMSTVQSLRGNVLVLGRVRPFLAGEEGPSPLSADGLSRLIVRSPYRGQWTSFTLDRMLVESPQSSLHAEAESYALSAVEGFRSCILAYGPTGSGKTYTMFGPREAPGLIYSVASKVFELVDDELQSFSSPTPSPSRTDAAAAASAGRPAGAKVSVSVLEVYNETIRDLLDPFASPVSAKLVGSDLSVPGLKRLDLRTKEEFRSTVSRATRGRAMASTDVHDASSRSHCVIELRVTRVDVGGTQRVGKLVFVDLAGSESAKRSGVTGAQLEETKNINRSLSALGDVMEALERKDRHIPYRNSQLTLVLSDSLSRGSKVMMIATLAPGVASVDETTSTLSFSTRVRKIHLGRALADVQWKQLQLENDALKAKVKALEESAAKTASPARHAIDPAHPFSSPSRGASRRNPLQTAEDLARQNVALKGHVDRLELKLLHQQSQLRSLTELSREEGVSRTRREAMESESLKRRVRELEDLLTRLGHRPPAPKTVPASAASTHASTPSKPPPQPKPAKKPSVTERIAAPAPSAPSAGETRVDPIQEYTMRVEQMRLAKERQEQQRLQGQREQLESERRLQEQLEQLESERGLQEQLESERRLQEQLESERRLQEQLESERRLQEQLESEQERRGAGLRAVPVARMSSGSSELPALLESSPSLDPSSGAPPALQRDGSDSGLAQPMPLTGVVSQKHIQRAISLDRIKLNLLRRSVGSNLSQRSNDDSEVFVFGHLGGAVSTPALSSGATVAPIAPKGAPGHAAVVPSHPAVSRSPAAPASGLPAPRKSGLPPPRSSGLAAPSNAGRAAPRKSGIPSPPSSGPSAPRKSGIPQPRLSDVRQPPLSPPAPPAPAPVDPEFRHPRVLPSKQAMRPVTMRGSGQQTSPISTEAHLPTMAPAAPPVERTLRNHRLVANRQPNVLRPAQGVSGPPASFAP